MVADILQAAGGNTTKEVTMKDLFSLHETAVGSITPEGFIEITALNELEQIVGGLLDSDASMDPLPEDKTECR